jgi:hypothetical protein
MGSVIRGLIGGGYRFVGYNCVEKEGVRYDIISIFRDGGFVRFELRALKSIVVKGKEFVQLTFWDKV